MGIEKSAGSVTSVQYPHNDYTAYSNNPTPQTIVNREIVTSTGRISVGEGSSKYIKEENATYVGTKDGVMRFEGRQTTVGGKFIAGGTVMEGANAPSSSLSPEAQVRFQVLKAAEQEKAQRELEAKQVASNRAAALPFDLKRELVSRVPFVKGFSETFGRNLLTNVREMVERKQFNVEFKEEPNYFLKDYLELQAITKAVEKKMFGVDFEGFSNSSATPVFEKNGSSKVSTAVVTLPSQEKFTVLQEEPKIKFTQLPKPELTFEEKQAEGATNFYNFIVTNNPNTQGSPDQITGGYAGSKAAETFAPSLFKVQKDYDAQVAVIAAENEAVLSARYPISHSYFKGWGWEKNPESFEENVGSVGSGLLRLPETIVGAGVGVGKAYYEMGVEAIGKPVSSEERYWTKQVFAPHVESALFLAGTVLVSEVVFAAPIVSGAVKGLGLVGKTVLGAGVGGAFMGVPSALAGEKLEAVAGKTFGGAVLGGGLAFGAEKFFSKKASAATEAIFGEGNPLSVSRGLVIGEETGRGLAVRVKAVKTVLGETGLTEVPIDATFLGSVKLSAGKQARAFIRANKAAVAEAGGRFKVLSVDKTASSILYTESEAIATGKGLWVELKGVGTNVFTRDAGAPNTMSTSVGEVKGAGVVNIPKWRWRLNVGAKTSFPNALEKIRVRGKDVPFSLDYVSTGGGGIVEGARLDADFAGLGKNVVDASTGKARQELFVNSRTVNTPVTRVQALQDFVNRHPKLLRLSVGAKESFPKALEYIKSKTTKYGAPSTEESFFKLTELGEKKGKQGTVELYSGHGNVYPNEPIGKPLTLGGRRYVLSKELPISVERNPLQLEEFNFNEAIKNLKRFRSSEVEFGGYLDKEGNIIHLIKGTKTQVEFVGYPPEKAVASFHSHPGGHSFPSAYFDSLDNVVGGDVIALHGRKLPDFIVSRKSLTLYNPREVGYAGVEAKNYFLKDYVGKRARYSDLDIQQIKWNIPTEKVIKLVEARRLEQFGSSKNYFFGKVKRFVTSKENVGGGASNRPLSNSGGGASVDVDVGGGSKQVMELSKAGSKLGEPRVLAVPSSVDAVQIRAAASKAVSDFYSKQAVRSSSLGVVSVKAVTGSSKVSRNAFQVSNRSGTMQFTRIESRTSMQPVSRVSNRSNSILENKTDTRTVNRMFDVNAVRPRAVSLTGTVTETRVGVGAALRLVSNTAPRTATRTATLTLPRLTITPITPPPVTVTPPPLVPVGIPIPKGSVLSDRRRKRFPDKFFLKSKSKKTGRAPLSDLFNLNVTSLAIRGKAHSPSVRVAEKFFRRSSGLVVPTAEQIASKFKF